MEGKSFRALMAQFNTERGGPRVGGVPTKLATQSRPPSRSPLLAKIAALENSHKEQTPTTTSSPAPSSVFQNKVDMASRENSGTLFPKPSSLKPSSVETSKNTECSGSEPSYTRPVMKRTPVNTAFLNKTTPPPSVGSTRPPWVKDVGSENTPNIPHPPPISTPKTSNTSLQSHTNQGTSNDPPEPINPKMTSNFLFKSPPPMAQQNTLSRQGSGKENVGAVKASLQKLNSDKRIPPKPCSPQKPTFLTNESGAREPLVPQKKNDDLSAPKRSPLPNIFSLGKPPVKPNRPPNVNLHQFRMDDPAVRTVGPLPSPTIPQTTNFPEPPPLCVPPPSADMGQANLESYDDVGIRNLPPPLPPGGHPNQKTGVDLISEEMYEDLDERWTEKEVKKTKEKNTKEKNKPVKEESSDEEMYEDLDKRWSEHDATGSKETKEQEKKNEKEKSDKEEKKRLEQERKLQKAREKREQEAKKKYKLSDQIQVIHTAKSRLDSKGGKSDLPLKQGDTIDIIRITDNPDGRWLARNTEGVYGYVKTESVEIDYGLLKQKSKGPLSSQSTVEPDVYDDVAVQDNASSGKNEPAAKDFELYDDVDTANPNRFPPPRADGDDVYDDVDSQVFPPPPPLDSITQLKGKQGEIDPKKKKKLEKEEKEFRKRFKFEGDIQVLYEVTIVPSLANKKWGNKDLQLKPEEVIDVIVKPTDGKLIGRNRDGKFGYVSMTNVKNDAGDIYDDIGEDCIYDND